MAGFAGMSSDGTPTDFPLYPYEDTWRQDDCYTSHAFTGVEALPYQPTTYEAYPNHQTFAQTGDFAFDGSAHQKHAHQDPRHSNQLQQLPHHRTANLHPPSNYNSPSSSASQTFDYTHPPVLSSTSDSGASVQSSLSSTMGSPALHPQLAAEWSAQQHMAAMMPDIAAPSASFADFFARSTAYDFDPAYVPEKGCVDPSLIQPTFSVAPGFHADANVVPAPLSSPAPSHTSNHSIRRANGRATSSPSPYLRAQGWQPYPAAASSSRRASVGSDHSHHSQKSHSSTEELNKGQCPIATCGRHVKDLKAHILTHQLERPEKCPIPSCEYHFKGFARKYDKNRHTLTHYKGTMVCGFCPGSGSADEKSFNRADVFKRHLTSVHNVEQTPSNARRRSPAAAGGPRHAGYARDATGMCSTCGVTFDNAQDFYDHLDDCVLRVVQQADPSEAINERLLTELADDPAVSETMEKHMLPAGLDFTAATAPLKEERDEDEDESGFNDEGAIVTDEAQPGKHHPRARLSRSAVKANKIAAGTVAKKGLTYSKNGVALLRSAAPGSATAWGKGHRRRGNLPLSWGAAPESMRVRKRVMCVYDGQRRLWKDDMMLDADHEVRLALPTPAADDEAAAASGTVPRRAWITDLDIQTLRRAEGLHNATDEEKGPWISDEDVDADLESLMA